MQLNSVYLYSNRVDAFTNLSIWETGRYRKVYNKNIKIYRSIDNRIDFQIRNSDEKSIALTSTNIVFTLIEPDTQKLLLQKDCTVVSSSTGKVFITLSEIELRDLDQGFYKYSLVSESRIESNGNYTVTNRAPLYVDAQYGILGTIEVAGDAFGLLKESTVVNAFSYTDPATTGTTGPAYYISSLIDAAPEYTTGKSLHTFQFYLTDYTGDIVVQGSLSEGASPHVWVDVKSQNYENSTSEYINVIGKYNFFRVKYIPTNSGTVDKILYR